MSCQDHFKNFSTLIGSASTLPATTGNIAMVCQDARQIFPKLAWKKYQPQKQAGKLCYFCCTAHSDLPIRDLTNDFGYGYKMEPSYETGTYNVFKSCNQPSVAAATRHGLSHLFFITKYTGTDARYKNKYFIVGTVEIDATAPINNRTAIHSPKMVFTDIEHAYEVTPERWQKICPEPKHPNLQNLRWATQQLEGELFEEIKQTIGEHDRSAEFLQEVERMNQLKYEKIRKRTEEQYLQEPN